MLPPTPSAAMPLPIVLATKSLQNPDPPHPLGSRRQRPSYRAANTRNEIASPHLQSSSFKIGTVTSD
jgi:hypothetical protein